MSLDHLALPCEATVTGALAAVAAAREHQPQALTACTSSIAAVPAGVATLVALV